jgi:multidrug efflux pump
VLAALGYSVNVLTLLALVLAIGLVVDDAIVVLENVHRHVEEGQPPLLAALRGARQIGFAVIATTIVLVAVFVPLSFLGGNTGRLFREFGISVAAAVLFSGFVALTLTPMMCSKLLRPHDDEGWFYRVTQPVFDGIERGYSRLLRGSLRIPLVVILLAAAASAAAYGLFRQLPREFAPVEDRGIIFLQISSPEGSSMEYMRRNVEEVERRLRPLVARGVTDSILTIIAPGFNRPGAVNNGFGIIRMRSWDQRTVTQQEAARMIYPELLGIPGIRIFAINPPSLGQRGFSPPVQFILGGPSYAALEEWAERVMRRAGENQRLINLSKDYEETRPEIRVRVDRDRAADLGVSIEAIGRALETLLGSRRVTTFERDGKRYDVILQARADDRVLPSDLHNIYVRSNTGQLVPLRNLVTLSETASARDLARVDRLRAVTVSASLGPEYTLGEALDYLDDIADAELPAEARVSYGGQSREFKESSAALYFTFGLALLIVFLTLAAQFESFVHPAIIMVSVPLAVTGALGSMLLAGVSLNVYSQIGIIMLVGLVAKNAILIVEFANQLRDAGKSIAEAVAEASATRLRPILMTTISTMLGALPLAMATGAGAESRRALGVVVVGGTGFATVLSLFVVPVLYLLFARYTQPIGTIARNLSILESEHPHHIARAAE